MEYKIEQKEKTLEGRIRLKVQRKVRKKVGPLVLFKMNYMMHDPSDDEEEKTEQTLELAEIKIQQQESQQQDTGKIKVNDKKQLKLEKAKQKKEEKLQKLEEKKQRQEEQKMEKERAAQLKKQ